MNGAGHQAAYLPVTEGELQCEIPYRWPSQSARSPQLCCPHHRCSRAPRHTEATRTEVLRRLEGHRSLSPRAPPSAAIIPCDAVQALRGRTLKHGQDRISGRLLSYPSSFAAPTAPAKAPPGNTKISTCSTESARSRATPFRKPVVRCPSSTTGQPRWHDVAAPNAPVLPGRGHRRSQI